jgi:hypothetical protein
MGNPEGVGPSGDMVRREAMEVMRGQYEERCRVLYIQIADLIQERQKHVEFLETVFRQITDLRRDVASMAPAPPIFLQASPEAIERLVAAQATRALGPAVPVRSATEADVATLQEALHQARMTNQRLQKEVDSLEKVVFSLEASAQANQSLISQQADQIAALQNRVHELKTDARKWYRANGSFQLLDSAQEVIDRRIAAARVLESGELLLPPEPSS